MKKIKLLIIFIILIIGYTVNATSGSIRQSSVISCNGKYYGNHGSPVHWHIVEKQNDKWVSISKEVSVPSCYLKPVNTKEKVKFSKCSDGDTAKFIVGSEEKTVRFLAIDTPEIAHTKDEVDEPFGKEASEYTCNVLKKAQTIYLEYDGNSDKEDKYGRILAFVHVDDELLEAKLIEKGYAKVAYIYGDYAYVEELRELELKAKNKKLGIWSEEILADIQEEHTDETEEESFWEVIVKIIFWCIEKIFDL